MQKIKRISLALTLFFLFLFFVTMAHAQMSEKCDEVVKNMKVPMDRAMAVHKSMQQTLNSEPIDKYNRHVNILVGNLEREASRMERLLVAAKQRGCDKLVQMMRDHIVNTKNIYNEMMASIQLPAPKEPLGKQNEKLKSELEFLMEIH